MVGDYDAALDLTQEVFIKVYASLSRYRPEFKFSTWIYKIAHNAAIDHLRRHATREAIANSETDRVKVTMQTRRLSPEQESERQIRCGKYADVVLALPAPYRKFRTTSHTQDVSYEEIAEVTGLPLG